MSTFPNLGLGFVDFSKSRPQSLAERAATMKTKIEQREKFAEAARAVAVEGIHFNSCPCKGRIERKARRDRSQNASRNIPRGFLRATSQ